MGLPKSKNAVGLGNSLMNDRFGKGKGSDMRRVQGIKRTGPDGQTYVTNAKEEAGYVKMRSVTEQASLDEFLSTAELAGTDFTAEKLNNVQIIHRDQKNPYLLSSAEERTAIKKQRANKKRLTVPRRPKWDATTTAFELDERERESLLKWRRGLAELQESQDLLMTPFERNLEVWRQLWRVIERSDLVVQIVDARNPLMFRCDDLEVYVKEVDPKKNNLLLVNKADMMTLKQREAWAKYFKEAGINFRFFSAELAKESNEARGLYSEQVEGEFDSEDEDEDEDEDENEDEDEDELEIDSEDEEIDDDVDDKTLAKGTDKIAIQNQEEDESDWASEEEGDESDEEDKSVIEHEDPTRILSTDELEALFLQHAPNIDTGPDEPPRKTQIGLVGYPNVGKSSTINALLGAKKVSVSATPGKTKHFQTLHLSDAVVLCDCPGLVFPNFANTKAELVCNGVLPIDQLREYTGPAALVAQRIPRAFLEAIYGLKIRIRPLEEGGTGIPTGEEVLSAYAAARGFSTTGLGQPDESRAARYVLKDYVKGKLLFCHPPPSEPPIDGLEFNHELYDAGHLPQKRQTRFTTHDDTSVAGREDASMTGSGMVPSTQVQGQKTRTMDTRFFAPQGNSGHLTQPFQYKYSEQGVASGASGKQLSGRKLKTVVALEKGIDPADMKGASSKKHFKANKKRAKKVKSEYV